MDTYPPEFILHLQPTLVVTGLLPEKQLPSKPNKESPSLPAQSTPLPSTTTNASGNNNPEQTLVDAQKAALLDAMLSRNNVTVWDNSKGLTGSLYFVTAAEKTFTLPPTRKSLQQTHQHHQHASLSPTSQTSPLYPDGLISPLWIRRHREVIPSVLIAFRDLWDKKSALINDPSLAGAKTTGAGYEKGPLGVIDPLEREQDVALAQDLLEHRKAAQERNVKFAAVLILRRAHMEDPSIEDRLSFVRKSAGLDSKNSFYVLPPSNQREIVDFAINLQRSQYEGSMNYYREQVKRHRKKRTGLPSTTSSVRPVQTQAQFGSGGSAQAIGMKQPQGLSVQGWMLRYEFKMGMFSECKQDIENAIKHYESAYGLLIDMLAPTSTVTPGVPGLKARTRRWAEAKVLADCICLKICKFHLYLDAPSTALFHYKRHLKAFRSFSEHWGMGDVSFEYWAWLSKQYRVMGELLDVGTKAGLKLPAPTPGSVVYSSLAANTETESSKFGGIGIGSGGTFGAADLYSYGSGSGRNNNVAGDGINPLLVLQHAGYFFHQAANCSVQRKLRFLIADGAFPDRTVDPTPTVTFPNPPSLNSLNSERNVDHTGVTIDLLTKSYEQFKRYKAGRMTLFLASEIAGSYYNAGRFDMALKFFERIGKTYRKEGWNLILTSILKWSIQCAKELGLWENVVEYLLELTSPAMPLTDAKRLDAYRELESIIYTREHPANANVRHSIALQMDHINSFVRCSAIFKTKSSFVSTVVPFQVQLCTNVGPANGPAQFPLKIVSIEILFSDPAMNHLLQSSDEAQESKPDLALKNTDRDGRTLQLVDASKCVFDASIVEATQEVTTPQVAPLAAEVTIAGNTSAIDEGEATTAGAAAVTLSRTAGAWRKSVPLELNHNSILVLQGSVFSKAKQDVSIKQVNVKVASEFWDITLCFNTFDTLAPTTLENPNPSEAPIMAAVPPSLQHMPLDLNKPRTMWLEERNNSVQTKTGLWFRNIYQTAKYQPQIRFKDVESKVEIRTRHKSPAFLDEYFPVLVKVRNGENQPVEMQMELALQSLDTGIESLDCIVLDPHATETAALANQGSPATRPVKVLQDIRLGSANSKTLVTPSGAWAEQLVYIKAVAIPTPRTVICKVRYQIETLLGDETSRIWTEKQSSFKILFIPPFDAEVVYTPQFSRNDTKVGHKETPLILQPNHVDNVHGTVLIPALTRQDKFLMTTKVNSEGPWPIEVQGVKLVLGSAIEAVMAAGVVDRNNDHPQPQTPFSAASDAGHPGVPLFPEASVLGGLGLSHRGSVKRTKGHKKSLQEAGIQVEVLEEGHDSTLILGGESTNALTIWESTNLTTFNHLVQVTMADQNSVPNQIEVGYLQVTWRRHHGLDSGTSATTDNDSLPTSLSPLGPFTKSIVPLQSLTIPRQQIYMTVDLPKFTRVNKLFTALFRVFNPTGQMQELGLTVEAAEGMVYAGTMQTTIKLLPYGELTIPLNCFPLIAGLVRLPRLRLLIKPRKIKKLISVVKGGGGGGLSRSDSLRNTGEGNIPSTPTSALFQKNHGERDQEDEHLQQVWEQQQQLQQQQQQQQPQPQYVPIRGAVSTFGQGSGPNNNNDDYVVVFVKPEAGDLL